MSFKLKRGEINVQFAAQMSPNSNFIFPQRLFLSHFRIFRYLVWEWVIHLSTNPNPTFSLSLSQWHSHFVSARFSSSIWRKMKHAMHPRNTILRETHLNQEAHSPNPSSLKQRKQKSGAKENAPPQQSDLGQVSADHLSSPMDPRKPAAPSPMTVAKMKSPLPPRPPLKRKLSLESSGSEKGNNPPSYCSDSGVKVILGL